MLARSLLASLIVLAGCGSTNNDNGEPCTTASCTNNATTAQNNSDPSCDAPACPAGEFQEFGTCDDPSCVTRMSCGEEVVCRNQTSCLAVSSCADGGLLLDACPPNSQGCLPYMVCGITKYCPTLQQCARDVCDAGESATTVACSDASITLPCREVTACGTETVSCVCRAEDLFCEEEEMFDTNPCTPGQMCREVMGCGTTFYCKGGSI